MNQPEFGIFVSSLRKEQSMTQLELAKKLTVTDKAISKWECGLGFPDIKLIEPLANALDISLVELINGKRNNETTISRDEANQAVSEVLNKSKRLTFKINNLIKNLLLCVSCLGIICIIYFSINLNVTSVGVIGSAGGPTQIFFARSMLPSIVVVITIACLISAAILHKKNK